jgi:hypothetical protein
MSGESDTVKEVAKATQEVAKTAGKAVDAGRSVGGFLDRVFGQAIEDTVGVLWTDKIRARRIADAIYSWEQLQLLAHKVTRRLEKKGVTEIRMIPPKIALPLLECATAEFEDDLHTLWANLLASGVDARARQVHRKYVTTLAVLTGDDALVLEAMFMAAKSEHAKKEVIDSSLTYGPSVDGTGTHDAVCVITLNRLGLIEPSYTKFKTFLPGGHNDRGDYGPTQDEVRVLGDLYTVSITPFGYAFGEAIGLNEAAD